MTTLLLRLAGPMQSWGVQSRFTVRETAREPSRSGVIGLLCAALGRPRDADLDDFARLRMDVRVEREGRLMRDYHTAGGSHRADERDYGVRTADGQFKREAVTSNRYYLADAEFLVALESEDPDWLHTLHEAVERPHWPLYLGRRAFVPGSPVRGGLQLADAAEVLRAQPWRARSARERDRMREQCEGLTPPRLRLVVECDPDGADVRWDVPLSFADRRYAQRTVKTDYVSLTSDMIEVDPLCTSHD